MRALSIRQPCAELILRGTCGEQIKPIELRSRSTKIIGERFYIYASQQGASGKLILKDLPRGVIVGTASSGRGRFAVRMTSDRRGARQAIP